MRASVAAVVFFAFALLTVSASPQDVAPPVIDLVSPESGPEAGGTIVNLYGRHFDSHILCFAPCPTRVFFDDAEGELLLESDTLVAVRTPKHDAGPSVITLRRPDNALATARFSFVADHDEFWEPILLPILVEETPGAFGSRWISTFWLHNHGNEPLPVAHLECPEACPEVFPLTLIVPPGKSIENPPIGINKRGATPGTLIYVPRSRAADARFSLRVRDLSRQGLTWGAEIPVVRVQELLSGTSELIDVPIGARFRSALRIYDPLSRTRLDFRVRFFPIDVPPGYLGPPIFEALIQTHSEGIGGLPAKPGYAQILDLRSAFPGIPLPSRARIEIEPVTPGIRYWAFASVTNDETQHVTIVTAQ